LALTIALVEWEALAGLLRQFNPAWLIPLVALKFLTFGLSAVRWRIILAAQGIAVATGRLFRYYLIGWFFNSFLPPMVGADAVRVLVMNESRSVGAKFASVVVERAAGLLALVLFGLLASASPATGAAQPTLVLIMATVLLLAGGSLLLTLFPDLWRWAMPRHGVARLSVVIGDVADAGQALRRRWRWLLAAMAISAAIQGLVLFSFYVRALALGMSLTLPQAFAAGVAVTLLITVPLSPGGVGSHEAAFVVIYGAFGIAPTDAFALALLSRALDWAVALTGGLLWLRSGAHPSAGTVAPTSINARDP
jgi:hypothetical protein